MDNRPVLITGGAGFIGSNIADRLAGEGHRVLVYDALTRPGVERNLAWLQQRHGALIEPIVADIRDAQAVASAVRGAKAVFHMAAQVGERGAGLRFASADDLRVDQLKSMAAWKTSPSTWSTMPISPPIRSCAPMASMNAVRSISTPPMAVPRARPTNMCSIMPAATTCRPPCCE